MMAALFVLLVLVFLNSVVIERVYQALPLVELRRRARAGRDKHVAALYKMMAYGPTLQLSLWLRGTLSALVVIVWAARTGWVWALTAGLLIGWLTFTVRGGRQARTWELRYAQFVAPPGAKILSILQPLLGKPAVFFKSRQPHTALYEAEDLINLLRRQVRQSDNRISEADLQTAHAALNFAGKTVGQTMTPRAKAAWIAAGEPIGPTLMDELHKTGQIRFAIVKEKSKAASLDALGSLYLPDLLENLRRQGHVRDIMRPGVGYIDETASLHDCLEQFLKTGRQLLVVTNSFEETAGVITLEDVLAQITGRKFTNKLAEPAGLEADKTPQTDK